MNIVIRADASSWLGVGHVSRCLSLAHKLKHEHTVSFITEAGLAEQLIGNQGFSYYSLPQKTLQHSIQNTDDYIQNVKNHMAEDAKLTNDILQKLEQVDWVIVDHYAIDEQWHKQIRPYTEKIMVIDDLANRHYDCDLLLDQNYYNGYATRYDGLVAEHSKLLLGPDYMLFRDEFILGRNVDKRIRKELRKVLVFYGGSDPTNETIKVLAAIEQLNMTHIQFDIVTGKLNKQKEQIQAWCEHYSFVTYHEQVDYMAKLMKEADLAIGAGGATTWERAILGLPAVVTILADNQRQGIEQLEQFGFIDNIGLHKNVTSELIVRKIKHYMDCNKLEAMSHAAYQFFNQDAQFTNQVVRELG